MARPTEVIDKPFQLVCEGPDDIDFFVRLVRDLNIAGYQIGCGKGDDNRCLGRDGFGKRLDAIKNTAAAPVQGYIIVADSDHNPEERFRFACRHLRDNQLPVPDTPWQVADREGIKTAVMTLPALNREGGLETLLLDCCDAITPVTPCIEGFCNCVMQDENPPRRPLDAHKLRLRALIASTTPDDPSCSISYWLSSRRRPFDMTHVALASISTFLRTFVLPRDA